MHTYTNIYGPYEQHVGFTDLSVSSAREATRELNKSEFFITKRHAIEALE